MFLWFVQDSLIAQIFVRVDEGKLFCRVHVLNTT